MVVFGCRGDAPVGPLTDVEAFACEVHPNRRDASFAFMIDGAVDVSGTAAWLARLPVLHASPCRPGGSS